VSVAANPFDLTGKAVLITGGNSGLGLGWATAVARAGGDVVIWGRRAEANEAAATTVRAYGGKVLAQSVDVSDEQQVVAGVAAAVEQFGRLHGAIANAGISTHPPSFTELGSEIWHGLLNINLHGAYYTLREVARHMVERAEAGDPGGSLITCGSLAVTNGVPASEHYSAAKGALAGVTKSMAVELGRHGIRANMVLPGRIATNLGGDTPEQKHAQVERSRVIPIPRFGTPEDCAGIVVYLLSDAASYHTGDLITVDGGLSIRLP
jgi:NAD(P)-dependent dehydrogenase (short-subunit alcohol dehydrogenase family)